MSVVWQLPMRISYKILTAQSGLHVIVIIHTQKHST